MKNAADMHVHIKYTYNFSHSASNTRCSSELSYDDFIIILCSSNTCLRAWSTLWLSWTKIEFLPMFSVQNCNKYFFSEREFQAEYGFATEFELLLSLVEWIIVIQILTSGRKYKIAVSKIKIKFSLWCQMKKTCYLVSDESFWAN